MFSLKEEDKKIKRILFIVTGLFFVLCLISVFVYGNSTLLGSLKNPDNDDVKFIRSGWILAETGRYVYHYPPHSTVFMMPGVSIIMAFFTIIFGKMQAITAFRILQAIFQTGSIFLVFFIARKIFNSKVAIAAVILNAIYLPNIWVANLVLTETFFKFFVLLLIYFSIYAIETKKIPYYITGGIVWALATYFRPTIALFPIIILIMWIIKKYSIKDMVKYALITAAVFCLALSPWWIRNYVDFHRFIPLTLATGNPMLQGTYINYDESTKKTDGLNYAQFVYPKDDEIGNNKIEMEISKYRLKNLVPKHPVKYLLWYTVGKTYYQIAGPFYWKAMFGINTAIVSIFHILVLITGVIGIIFSCLKKDKNSMCIILFADVIYFILVYLPFYAFGRYFYPAVAVLMILSAYGILRLFKASDSQKKA